MSTPIVIQLQELASSGNENATNLLRKALIVSTKLQLSDITEWISLELNGYTDYEKLPRYRIAQGELKAKNPMRGLIPLIAESPEMHDAMARVNICESIPSLIQMLEAENGIIAYYFDPGMERKIMSWQSGPAMRPVRIIGKNILRDVIENTKTNILEWALRLEANGILGRDLTFSSTEKDVAMSTKTINITNFQGLLGDVFGGTVSQTNTMEIKAGDMQSLKRALGDKGLSEEQLAELESAITADPKSIEPGRFGPKVSNWMGKMIANASSGAWGVGIAAAGDLLSKAIGAYYGIN